MDYSKLDGLIPAVIQDAESAEVLMLGFMNDVALAETRRTGYATFFSRMGWWWTGLKYNLKAVPYPALSATEPDTQFQYSVIVMEHEEGDGSTVLLGLYVVYALLHVVAGPTILG